LGSQIYIRRIAFSAGRLSYLRIAKNIAKYWIISPANTSECASPGTTPLKIDPHYVHVKGVDAIKQGIEYAENSRDVPTRWIKLSAMNTEKSESMIKSCPKLDKKTGSSCDLFERTT
jgi:hypothetical protein